VHTTSFARGDIPYRGARILHPPELGSLIYFFHKEKGPHLLGDASGVESSKKTTLGFTQVQPM